MRFLAPLFAVLLIAGASLDLGGCAGSQRTDNAQGTLATFRREMLEAVDAEKRYPYGERGQGVVTIGFDYGADGKADNLEIVQSSGDASLDHAALMAVYFAKFPPKPPELDSTTRFVVHVDFETH